MAEFFDRMLVGINKGVNTVSENSKFLLDKARLNTEIKDTEDRKNKFIQQLGALAYNLYSSGAIAIEEFDGICTEITNCDTHVTELKSEIQRLEMAKNANINGSATVASAPTYTVEDGAVCTCGFINKPGSKFCAKCGSAIEQ